MVAWPPARRCGAKTCYEKIPARGRRPASAIKALCRLGYAARKQAPIRADDVAVIADTLGALAPPMLLEPAQPAAAAACASFELEARAGA